MRVEWPQRSISRTFHANVRWLRRPGPWPGRRSGDAQASPPLLRVSPSLSPPSVMGLPTQGGPSLGSAGRGQLRRDVISSSHEKQTAIKPRASRDRVFLISMNRNAEARPAPSRTRNAPGHNAFPASLRPGDPSSRPRFRTARDSARETQSQSDSNSVTDMRARHCSSLLERRQRLKFTREDLNPSSGLSRAAADDT